jgi:hypothetical protein
MYILKNKCCNVRDLKNKSSFGFDEFPPTLAKQCNDELAAPLTFLINQSFAEATFPDLLKTAIIKPVPKTKGASDPNDFRPIALLSTFSKIFETAMAKRLNSFCDKHAIYNDSQYGFRKRRSTISALYRFTNEILNIIDSKKHAIAMMLDMSKAYDRVSHRVLLDKLYGIGVRGITHRWFKSYLEKRQQFVEIDHYNSTQKCLNTCRSQKSLVKYSIPQGSTLGCILFLLYINDLPKILDNNCILYADDITVVLQCDDNDHFKQQLNITMEKIIHWLNDHNLKLNVFKTKLIQIKPRQKNPINTDFSYGNEKLVTVNSCALLGIEVDSELNWKKHVAKISGKLSQFTYALYQLKSCTNLKTAISAYYAYGHARLNYGIILWGNSTHVSNLFILQKKCIRILVNIKQTESCRCHFTHLKILTLTSMYIYEICKFVRNNKTILEQNRDNCSTVYHNLRSRNKLTNSLSKMQIVRAGTHHMAVNIYNGVPLNIRKIEKFTMFCLPCPNRV